MIRFGVVGCGFVSQTAHLPSLESIPEAEIRIVCDLREDVAKVIAQRYRCDWTTDPDKVFEREDLEAVTILTPQSTHASSTIDALEHGKHVIVEKPMAMSSKEGKTMNETASKCGLKLVIVHMKRYDSGVVKAKDVIQWGMIGQPVFGRFHGFCSEWVANRHTDVGTYGTCKDPSYFSRKKSTVDAQVTRREAFMNSRLNQFTDDTNCMRFFLGDPSTVELASSYREETHAGWLNLFGVTVFSWDKELKATLEFGGLNAKSMGATAFSTSNIQCSFFGVSLQS